jgi:8-oxo-dGTP pyrophosphatase MutT (NUDIX family)
MPNTETTAKAIVRRSDGSFLTLRSSKWEERPDRSQKPDLPGGMVEAGESPLMGVSREVSEEVGIQVPDDDFTLVYTATEFYDDTQTSVIKHVFLADVEDVEVKLSWEHEAYEWLTAEEFRTIEWRPFYSEALDYLFTHGLL